MATLRKIGWDYTCKQWQHGEVYDDADFGTSYVAVVQEPLGDAMRTLWRVSKWQAEPLDDEEARAISEEIYGYDAANGIITDIPNGQENRLACRTIYPFFFASFAVGLTDPDIGWSLLGLGYAGGEPIGTAWASSMLQAYDSFTAVKNGDGYDFSAGESENWSIQPIEYYEYDPGDGLGPIYDSATGAQLRAFPS